jgi:hypothetical protein
MPNWLPAQDVYDIRLRTLPTSPQTPTAGSLPQGSQATLVRPYSPEAERISGLAVASLVLGILWLCGLGSLLATIFGAVALSQISRSNGRLSGRGLALAGLVLGIVGLALWAIYFFLVYLGLILSHTQR